MTSVPLVSIWDPKTAFVVSESKKVALPGVF